jgi:hypothetical protein
LWPPFKFFLRHPICPRNHLFCSRDQQMNSRDNPLKLLNFYIRNFWLAIWLRFKQILLNFSHRNTLVAHSFPSVIWLLVIFRENYFLRNTPQGIMILMTPVLSIYHVRGWKKGGHTHRRNKDNIYIVTISKSFRT